MSPGDSATRQEVRLGGPPTRTRREDITRPDQVAPQGRKASSTRKIKPQTSNHKTKLHVSDLAALTRAIAARGA